MATRSSTKTLDIYTSTVSTSTIYTVSTDQVVQVAEDVDAEQRGAHRQDVEVELVVGQHAHVPAIRTLDYSDTHIERFNNNQILSTSFLFRCYQVLVGKG